MKIRDHTDDAIRARNILRDNSSLDLGPLGAGSVIVDLGAGVGLASVYYAIRYPQARLYSFESDPRVAEILRFNANRYSTHIKVYESRNPWPILKADGVNHLTVVAYPPDPVGENWVASLPESKLADARLIHNDQPAETVWITKKAG
ncbi:MAG: hypothetical protein GC164_09440 [Phycisphaera sp.]|nr:hypothetical protein [Phycisphaera sp.]